MRTTSVWPFSAAMVSAVAPPVLVLLKSARLRKRLRTTVTWPPRDATISGVAPSSSSLLTLLAACCSLSRVSRWPPAAASCSGVAPVMVSALGLPLRPRMMSITSGCPRSAAMCRGVNPSSVTSSTFARLRSNSCTASALPVMAALYSGVCCRSSLQLTDAPASRRASTTSIEMSWCCAAIISGVCPKLLAFSLSAPSLSRYRTTSGWLRFAATASGVMPSLSGRSLYSTCFDRLSPRLAPGSSLAAPAAAAPFSALAPLRLSFLRVASSGALLVALFDIDRSRRPLRSRSVDACSKYSTTFK
mmetsp:Transcript_7196/g.18472  ORF Transcript_7196/g.18472 Transcript_7196/m.18472 type:complete len:303 (-) Transcript_7196:422-1330(-)